MFNNAKETYDKALESSGFTEKLTYIQPNKQNQNNRETKRKEKGKLNASTPLFLWISKPMLESYSLKF